MIGMENEKTVEVEIEGGGITWWFVCEECHAAVDPKQEYCPVCKRRLIWREG